ncbi:MAG: phospholipase [Methanomicrobiales archaeon]|nr:phospholipase [Methanomicrobiales archaeon]
MQVFPLILLVGFFCTGPVSALMITEFCPDPYLHGDADEYIVLSGYGPLDSFTISDGRGGFRFPPGATINRTLVVAMSGTAYAQNHGVFPDYEWLDNTPQVPDVVPGDTLRMANARDMLLLYDDGVLVQNISWPEDVKAREGQVHFYENGRWDPRPLMLGQSRFATGDFSDVTVTTFVSPDSSAGVFMAAVDGASQEILLNVYEFSSPEITESLIAAKKRNVSVTILVEGGPVGGISREENAALWSMNQSGIPVYAMMPARGEHAPYRYDHAKYLLVDKKSTLITSENFKYSGFPPEGMSGNRGWGAYLENPALASYFSMVFSRDMQSGSVKPYAGIPGDLEVCPTTTRQSQYPSRGFTGAQVRPVIAPDTSEEILHLINSAATSIEIEQAYITNESTSQLNPYLDGAIDAARRGVKVRIMLDSYWFNMEGMNDNDEMVVLINRIGAAENIPLEARCADLSSSHLDKIHNKGVIVDGEKVLISSINWNSNSPNFNREAGVIITHPGVAGYFREVFDADWNPAVQSASVRTDYGKIALVVIVVAVLLLFWYRRHMR